MKLDEALDNITQICKKSDDIIVTLKTNEIGIYAYMEGKVNNPFKIRVDDRFIDFFIGNIEKIDFFRMLDKRGIKI